MNRIKKPILFLLYLIFYFPPFALFANTNYSIHVLSNTHKVNNPKIFVTEGTLISIKNTNSIQIVYINKDKINYSYLKKTSAVQKNKKTEKRILSEDIVKLSSKPSTEKKKINFNRQASRILYLENRKSSSILTHTSSNFKVLVKTSSNNLISLFNQTEKKIALFRFHKLIKSDFQGLTYDIRPPPVLNL